jgi:hypothetical protein
MELSFGPVTMAKHGRRLKQESKTAPVPPDKIQETKSLSEPQENGKWCSYI